MSENRNRGILSKDTINSMSTEELEEILRMDTEVPEGEESDIETLLNIMEVLENRGRNNKDKPGKTAFEAWESFQQNYLPVDEAPLEYKPKESVPAKAPARWLRWVIAAAATIALVVCIPVSARAFSWEEVLEVFARWAKETFSFVGSENAEVSEPISERKEEYSSLQELLIGSDRRADIVPSFIPSRFVLSKVEKTISPVQEIYIAYYTDSEKELMIHVQNYISEKVQNTEIEESIIEVYTSNGVDYFIFPNVDQLQAIWTIDSFECIISGDLSIEEIKEMIDSI